MTQLNDHAIEQLLINGRLVKNYKKNQNAVRDLRVQPASFDMTVGSIYRVPSSSKNDWTVSGQETGESCVLQPGETILVQSAEELDVPQEIAGLGSPPASLSSKGMLMVSPGHIDPGYNGHLLFTLINMGKEPLPIKQSEPIFTTVWFYLSAKPEIPYDKVKALAPASLSPKGRIHEYLGKLSNDFLNVDSRATTKAKNVVFTYGGWSILIGVLFTILIAIAPNLMSMIVGDEKEISDLKKTTLILQSDIKEMKDNVTLNTQKEQIEKIQKELADMNQSLSKLEISKKKSEN